MKSSLAWVFTAALILFTCTNIFAQQVPVVEWQKCLGSNGAEYFHSIQPTSDGGYITAGYRRGADNGDVMGHHGDATFPDIWLVKMDRAGQTEWQRSLGGSSAEERGSIIQTPDGGYMLAGSAISKDCGMTGNHGGFDFWVVKLNSNGGIVWQKMYGGSSNDDAHSISPSADGGFFVAGLTRSTDGDVTGHHGNVDAWVIKIDAKGNLIWQKALGGSHFEHARAVQATPDGGCVVAAITGSDDGDVTGFHGAAMLTNDCWVVKLDIDGAIEWQKALGGSMSEPATSIQITKDGGYIVAGMTSSSDGDVSGNRNSLDGWVVKLDATGNIVWEKTYGGSGNETVNHIDNTPDGGYVFTGNTGYITDGDLTCNAGSFDIFIMKINATGTLEWQKTLGGSKYENGQSVKALNDGSFIVGGYTDSPDIPGFHVADPTYSDDDDYWIIKLSAPFSVIPAPVVTIDPASAIICSNGKATLTASVLYGGVSPIYQWSKNGMPVGTNSSQYTDFNLAANDEISCAVKRGNACEDNSQQGSDAITITLKNNPATPGITIVADNTSSCSCADITMKANILNGGGAPNYQWKVNGNDVGNNSSIFISNQLEDGDVITCSYSDNNICNVNGPVISNAIMINNSSNVIPSVSIEAPVDTICNGAEAVFTAKATNAGANPFYQWKINNVNAGANSRVFTSSALSNGDIVSCSISTDPLFTCVASTTVHSNAIAMHVHNATNPSVSITADATTICAGSTARFIATVENAGANPSYQWKINGVNTRTNEKNFSSSTIVNGDLINCTVIVDPLYSCTATMQAVSEDIIITVNNTAIASINITANESEICTGENIIFTAIANDAGANPSFKWILNNTILQNDAPVYTSSSLKNGDEVSCRVIPGTGVCNSSPVLSNRIVVVVNDTPAVYISPADTIITSGTQLQLNAVMPGNMASFYWRPADKFVSPLSLPGQTNPLHEATNFTLTVTNDKGCDGSAMAAVKIFTGFYMPNAFTPGNDGINDVFRIPPATTLSLKEFAVYDRWGTKLFSTINKETGWDGTFNGKKQRPGVYVYYIRSIINGLEVFTKGSVVLVR